MIGFEPELKTGETPVVEIDFVESGETDVIQPADDLAVRAAAGEQGVKTMLDLGGKPARLAPRFSCFSLTRA